MLERLPSSRLGGTAADNRLKRFRVREERPDFTVPLGVTAKSPMRLAPKILGIDGREIGDTEGTDDEAPKKSRRKETVVFLEG
jgi:hypothetical protein